MNAEIFFAISAGLFAAFSPCSLPAYTIILNIVSKGANDRRTMAVAFAGGLCLMFTLFYVALAFAIKILGAYIVADTLDGFYRGIYLLSAAVSVFFAVQTFWPISLGWAGFNNMRKTGSGILASFLTGALFATCVSPCNLPFLIVTIVPLMSARTTVWEGLIVMAAFSLSLSAPILMVGLFSEIALKRIKRYVRHIEVLSAFFLLVAAAYFSYMALFNGS
jgi:cytochrome c biogenesis protein CcdA